MGDGRADSQACWQEHVGAMFSGVSILDVGSGYGHSKARLSNSGANRVTTSDPERSRMSDVDVIGELRDLAPADIVTAFDVIEHAARPDRFVRELVALARRGVFVTTIDRVHAPHPWHWSPSDFLTLVEESTPFGVHWRYFHRHKFGDGRNEVVEVDRDRFICGGAYGVGVFVEIDLF